MANNPFFGTQAEVEEGELTDESEDIYVPLPRPVGNCKTLNNVAVHEDGESIESIDKLDTASENDSSSSSDDSESQINTSTTTNMREKTKQFERKCKRIVMVRVNKRNKEQKSKYKKYNIWTDALQEDALSEDMRQCDVTINNTNDRNVENYDFLKFRPRKAVSLKRGYCSDAENDSNVQQKKQKENDKLIESGNYVNNLLEFKSEMKANELKNLYKPRYIKELHSIENKDNLSIAREMAENLRETKSDLLVQIINVLGLNIPLEVYKETQRIEADGGMTIKSGNRRRTSGGVFLFLLKNHGSVSLEQQKEIFAGNKSNGRKRHRENESISRNRKVEELKKCLNKNEGEIVSQMKIDKLSLLSNMENECNGNISNPPPSPVLSDDLKSMKSSECVTLKNDIICNVSNVLEKNHENMEMI